MHLLRNGQLQTVDAIATLDDADAIPDNNKSVLVGLERFLSLREADKSCVSGVVLAPDDNVMTLSPFIQQLDLLCVDFPGFTDGRAYSHARLLRQRLNYAAEIRATGDIREDQVLFMLRAGIDTLAFAEAPDMELIRQLVTRYQHNYQPSYPLPLAG